MDCATRILNSAEQSALLRLARITLQKYFNPSIEAPIRPDVSGVFGGAFVTFRLREKLRGCVGTLAPTRNLARSIEEVTLNSLHDPRFADAPIQQEEEPRLGIEISVVSEMQPIDANDRGTPGVHGIWLKKGASTGCFLPRVALDHGWNWEQFLSNCCTTKAMLAADAWNDANTELRLFTVQAFTESDSLFRP